MSRNPDTAVEPEALPSPAPNPDAAPQVLDGQSVSGDFDLPPLDMSGGFDDGAEGLPDLPMLNGPSDDPVARLRNLIGERQEETVEILRSWLEDKEENA